MNPRWIVPLASAAALLAASAVRPLRAASPGAGVIEGVVVDASGAPVQAWIELRDAEGKMPDGFDNPVVTGDDGRFRCAGLSAGTRFRLKVHARGCAWHRTEATPADGPALRIALAAERTLSGRIDGPDGKPVAGAEVRLPIPEAALAPSAVTADDGSFTLHDLSESPADLVVRARDRGAAGLAKWVIRRTATKAADDPLALVLGKGLTIEGKLTDGESPARHWGVMAVPRAASERELSERRRDDWPSAWTASDGSFRIAGLDAGRWTLVRWFGDGGGGRSGPPPKEYRGGENVEAGATGVSLTTYRPR